ncbi:hypothetical protein D3P96_00235 [Weissella viridescens]|uniref:Uncharacterized protein n=1 Tax=Weissella viridescens TaxID=1629 RepID=A0A3P2RLA7_WEIVI|nr:hypothetical protein [Weissella viridescens]RRG18452.1 hypothetical protein D3P96_00235 [Weissella viridescens]
MTKPKLFLDMDNVLVDTLPVLNAQNMKTEMVAKPDQIPGIFKNLPPVDGAVEAVKVLSEDYEMYILSTAPWNNPSAWQDKLIWLQKYFGMDETNPFYKRVVMAHDKGLVHGTGGILVDDRPYHGASAWDDESTDSFWLQYGFDAKLVWSNELVHFLQAVAQAYTDTQNIRAAIEEVNQQTQYHLHGDKESFEKASWEK